MTTLLSEPLVTVGVPTFNRGSYLGDTLSRIIEQDYRNLEVLVCDDGSTDETPDVVRRVHDPRLRYLRMPVNKGIPHVLNHILEECRGDAIVMLHDHDIHRPALVRSMAERLWADDVGFVNPGVAWMDPDGSNYEAMPPLTGWRVDGRELAANLLLGPTLSCPITACALVRRSAYEAVGFSYDPAFGFLSDVDLWLRLLMRFAVGQADGIELVCRRRDADHLDATVNWALLGLIRDIHRCNLRRLLRTEQEVRHGDRNLRAKVLNTASRSMTSAILRGDPNSFFAGLQFLATGEHGDVAARAARTALNHPRLSDSLTRILWLLAPAARVVVRTRTKDRARG
jgi:glycosyltransferase involved in cell wall biosynthesis